MRGLGTNPPQIAKDDYSPFLGKKKKVSANAG